MPKVNSANGTSSLLARLNASVLPREANNLLKLDKYYRSAELLLRQAEQYRLQHNQEQQYLMLMRLTSLVVETIPCHADFDPQHLSTRYAALREACRSRAVPELERLRLDLELKHHTAELLRGGDGMLLPWAPTKVPGAVQLSAGTPADLVWEEPVGAAAAAVTAAAAARPPALDFSPGMALPAASSATLSKHAVLPAPLPPPALGWAPPPRAPVAAPRALYPELIDLGWPEQQGSAAQQAPTAELASLDLAAAPPPRGAQPAWQPPAQPDGFGLEASQRAQQQQVEEQAQRAQQQPSPYGELALGPQELGVRSVPAPTAPPQPGDSCCAPPGDGALALFPGATQQQQQQPCKRQSVRDVHVSVALLNEFMRYATSNTRRGIETCGILAGSLSPRDAVFTINTLVVPKQRGTTDSVEMLNEEEMVDVILGDARGIYPLGWIHTHPSQSCFMSSIDVHTQAGYQTQMDEAVAIVMAPTDADKRVGIFRLTTPGGLRLVQACPHRGFHPHAATDTGQPLYELCGHVYLNPRAEFGVVDLR